MLAMRIAMQTELVTRPRGWLERAMSSEGLQGMDSNPPEFDAARLLEQVAEGADRTAFAGLFRHFAPRLKGFFRKRGLDDVESEELVQEIMLTVWRRAETYDPAKAAATTWIYTIARNRWIDRHRRENRPEIDPDDPLLRLEPNPTPDEAIEAEQRDRRVRDAMAGLPAEQIRLIRMSFYEDKPHSEIAAQLDLPLGTVKSRIRLAMGRMRRHLGEDA